MTVTANQVLRPRGPQIERIADNRAKVVIEPDKGGETVRKWLAASAIRDRARLVSLGEFKDPSGLHLADPAAFRERWQAALETAEPWTEIVQNERERAVCTPRPLCSRAGIALLCWVMSIPRGVGWSYCWALC